MNGLGQSVIVDNSVDEWCKRNRDSISRFDIILKTEKRTVACSAPLGTNTSGPYYLEYI